MVTSCTVLLFVSLLATGTRCSQFKTLCEVALVRQNWIPFKWFSSLQWKCILFHHKCTSQYPVCVAPSGCPRAWWSQTRFGQAYCWHTAISRQQKAIVPSSEKTWPQVNSAVFYSLQFSWSPQWTWKLCSSALSEVLGSHFLGRKFAEWKVSKLNK